MKKTLQPVYIYPLMIFIGFFMNYQYYSFFDISITSYITFSELLLRFLPVSNFLFWLLLLISYYLVVGAVGTFIEAERKGVEDKKYELKDITRAPAELFNFKLSIFKKMKPIKKIGFVLKYFLRIIITLFFALFLLYLLYNTILPDFYYMKPNFFILLSFFWLLIFNNYVAKRIKDLKEYKNEVISILIFFLLMFLSFFEIRKDAKDVLNGKPIDQVSFKFNNNVIETDSNFVFVGQTEKYFFLRNLTLKKNSIYSKDKIDLIEMTKIEYKK